MTVFLRLVLVYPHPDKTDFDMNLPTMYNIKKVLRDIPMKKGIYIIITAILCLSLFAPVGTAHAMPYFEEATVTADEVNMRMRPSTDSPVIMQLTAGTRIGVFCEEVEGWYRIIYGNYRGYISSEYVFLPSVDSMNANVLEGGLKLRSNPGAYSSVVSELAEGTGMKITDIYGEWFGVEISQAQDDGIEATLKGYVNKEYVKISTAKTASNMLKIGMSGAEVRNVQEQLRKRNFLLAPATGYFGDVTEGAVEAFQRKAGLDSDGIVGAQTYEMLFDESNGITTTTAELFGITGEVKLSTWDDIAKKFKKGDTVTVTDVKTGLQYKAYRFGGWFHADCEPVTKDDAAVIKKMFGGSWSWNRRAIWVTLSNGETYAASQHGMPHMVDVIGGNDFPGHFCIHFKDSKVHETSAECPKHQACVQYAYDKAH